MKASETRLHGEGNLVGKARDDTPNEGWNNDLPCFTSRALHIESVAGRMQLIGQGQELENVGPTSSPRSQTPDQSGVGCPSPIILSPHSSTCLDSGCQGAHSAM